MKGAQRTRNYRVQTSMRCLHSRHTRNPATRAHEARSDCCDSTTAMPVEHTRIKQTHAHTCMNTYTLTREHTHTRTKTYQEERRHSDHIHDDANNDNRQKPVCSMCVCVYMCVYACVCVLSETCATVGLSREWTCPLADMNCLHTQ